MNSAQEEAVPVCFACGSGVEVGQPIFGVKRLRQARLAPTIDDEYIFEAEMSLQVCAACVGRATKEAHVSKKKGYGS